MMDTWMLLTLIAVLVFIAAFIHDKVREARKVGKLRRDLDAWDRGEYTQP